MAVQAEEWMEFAGTSDFIQPVDAPQLQKSFGIIHQTPCDLNYDLNYGLPRAPPHSLAAHIERQNLDIDTFIALQNERLKSALNEQRRVQILSLIRRLESKAQILLQQKEEDIQKASRKNLELQECLRKTEMENETWRRIAGENEGMVLALNNALDQVRDRACCSSHADDTESCCDSSTVPCLQRDALATPSNLVCKACNSRSSCLLLLPCRHLCSCKSCEVLLDVCPVCRSIKKGSIEVYMS